MNIARTLIGAAAVAAAANLGAAVPEVSDVGMEQNASRLVTITYTLANGPAVVTVDVQTKDDAGAWTSIGGEALWNAAGDVWKKVEAGERTITWRPDLSWPDHKVADGGARAVVTAWALDNTPDYMVVDISSAAQPDTQRYYPAADFVPGGVTSDLYKTSTLLMRKIMAKGVTWTMGSTTLETLREAKEGTHQVTLDGNYYIGVYPVTQSQWELVQPSRPAPSYFRNASVRATRPVENVCYNELRHSADTSDDTEHYWPQPPSSSSFLGLLQKKTGIDFDLPSEAQWEYACRAGNGDTKWGDGSPVQNAIKDANLARLGRYWDNGGWNSNGQPDCGTDKGTAIVGSYEPNAWGIYDMHGNVTEWCLDWYEDDITGYGGKVNVDESHPAMPLSGNTALYRRVLRGGGWAFQSAASNRSAWRANNSPSARTNYFGFRVVCTAGLE